MASEAQRIVNLSLMKIMSSRNRKGGVSLHRNLLIASVLLKARDVYHAEMAGSVVIRDGYVYDKAAFDEMTDLDMENDTNDTDNSSGLDENLIEEEQILKTVNAVVVQPYPEDPTLVGDQTVSDSGSDAVLVPEPDNQKENLRPIDGDSSESRPPKTKRSRKSPHELCRKRKYTEVERAVLSIRPAEQDSDCSSSKNARLDCVESDKDISLECNELSSCLSEWCPDEVDTDSQVVPNSQYESEMSQEFQSYPDVCEQKLDDSCPSYENVTTYTPTFHNLSGSYFTSSTADSVTFSISSPILAVGV